jgi:hypothetical protein
VPAIFENRFRDPGNNELRAAAHQALKGCRFSVRSQVIVDVGIGEKQVTSQWCGCGLAPHEQAKSGRNGAPLEIWENAPLTAFKICAISETED